MAHKYQIVGFGFNGFGQLDVPQEDISSQNAGTDPTASRELSTSSPRVLMELSCPPTSVVVSSSWDSLNIFVLEGKRSHSVATGRWSSRVKQAATILGEDDRILEVVETPQGHLILRTLEKRLLTVFGSTEDSVKVEEWKSSQQFAEIRCLSDGTIYALLVSGAIHKCFFDPPDSCKLQLSHELPTGGHRIASMACGANHCLLLAYDGTVLSFGLGTRGQLGHSDIQSKPEPCVINALAGLPMKAIACGHWHSVVLSQSGDMYSWGWNEHGQLGLKTPPGPTVAVPTLVDGIVDGSDFDSDVSFVSVSCGSRHSAAVSESGVLYCWGWDEYGQLRGSRLCSCRVHSVYCGWWCTICSWTLYM